MVIVMHAGSTEEQIQRVIDRLVEIGFDVHRSTGATHTVLGAVGAPSDYDPRDLELLDGVREVVPITQPYKLASRAFRPEGTVVELGRGVRVGGTEVVVAAGPCAVESSAQIHSIAKHVAGCGARLLRGGAFKPRSSPYTFQGLGEPALQLLREAADASGLLAVSEVMDPSQIEVMTPYVDVFQVGARNMQNYNLLRALGATSKPVLLKRGMSATIEELLLSAEYILAGGNYKVMLCERGIRTFENYTRNTLDLAAIPVIEKLSHLPILVDPSHGTGRRDKVPPMARAAVAAGAHGLLIEVHNDPEHARSDGAQSLRFDQFARLMDEIRMIAPAVGRRIT
jgi:3-deoxy-7-phosphoheptulonate synthase